jgi:hypothetical protein
MVVSDLLAEDVIQNFPDISKSCNHRTAKLGINNRSTFNPLETEFLHNFI